MSDLYERLNEYCKSDYYPFHMPGHKRVAISYASPYEYDITEIDGFDNLHEPEGILRICMDEASKLYATKRTYFMVNGSSGGILAAISATIKRGGKILVARNSHKSVYNAIYLRELVPFYLYPGFIEELGINGGIYPEDVDKALNEHPDIEAVMITSPTYEGIVSDVKAIADIAHAHNVPLIVDEAHGAHFSMHEEFPESAVLMGADIIIQSMHKTLPSLTQTALLHLNGDIVSENQIEKYLRIFQTSSPSYVLMASMDKCIEKLKKDGISLFDAYVKRMNAIQIHCRQLTHVKVMNRSIVGKNGVYDYDISKVVISVRGTGYTGKMLYKELLDKYHLQLEMAAGDYAIAMTSLMDSEEGLLRLFKALVEIDRDIRVYGKKSFFVNYTDFSMQPAVVTKTMTEVDESEKEKVKLDEAAGKISAEFVFLYPPGIPIIAPGEMITSEIISLINKYRGTGLEIHGLKDKEAGEIEVIREKFESLKFGTI